MGNVSGNGAAPAEAAARGRASGRPLFALIASALSDALIVAMQMAGLGHYQPWLITSFTSLNLLALGALPLSRSLEGEADSTPAPLARDANADPEQDRRVIAALEALLAQKPLYIDPGLTLGQLSRSMHQPAKGLSAAINRATGENVSRYINRLRIDHACACLNAGENVTSAMLASGFNTKSNFNREFLRVRGLPPSNWATQ